MTTSRPDWRLDLLPGDLVTVQMDDGELKTFKVKYPAWQLGNGEWVIGLKGIAGGYLLSRVKQAGFATK